MKRVLNSGYCMSWGCGIVMLVIIAITCAGNAEVDSNSKQSVAGSKQDKETRNDFPGIPTEIVSGSLNLNIGRLVNIELPDSAMARYGHAWDFNFQDESMDFKWKDTEYKKGDPENSPIWLVFAPEPATEEKPSMLLPCFYISVNGKEYKCLGSDCNFTDLCKEEGWALDANNLSFSHQGKKGYRKLLFAIPHSAKEIVVTYDPDRDDSKPQCATGILQRAKIRLPDSTDSDTQAVSVYQVPEEEDTSDEQVANVTPKVPEGVILLRQAVKEGKVTVEIAGTGSSTGDCILVSIRRKTSETLRLYIPSGTILKSISGKVQDMVVSSVKGERSDGNSYRPSEIISLDDDSQHVYVVEAYCLDFHKPNPGSNDFFRLSPPDMDAASVLSVGKKCQAKINVIQSAIWFQRSNINASQLKQRFPVNDTDVAQARSLLKDTRSSVNLANQDRMDSDTIRRVQARLSEFGFSPGPVDGVWGKKTEKALMEYQRNHHLPLTGRADKLTMESLDSQTPAVPSTTTDSEQMEIKFINSDDLNLYARTMIAQSISKKMEVCPDDFIPGTTLEICDFSYNFEIPSDGSLRYNPSMFCRLIKNTSKSVIREYMVKVSHPDTKSSGDDFLELLFRIVADKIVDGFSEK